MCRPEGFQGFVFVGGVYAGRIAPHDMEPRTDGSPNALGPTIFLADEFQVDFMRYRASDALCCPHGVSSVTYRVTRANGVPLLVPVSVETRPTSSE
jgi:hypothetical protein